MTILEGIPLGKQYFRIRMILRDSLLVSSMLFNSETWYNLTSKELELLETVDLALIRQLLKAPKGTPKEVLYLELGIIPFRDIIIGRRLNFLYSILNENPHSLIYKFFEVQWKYRTRRDWVTLVQKDLEYLELQDLSLETIKNMKKPQFRSLVKLKIEEKTLEKLEKIKQTHSKVKILEHNELRMQKYLQPNSEKIRKEEAQLIFKLRSRMTNVKTNFRGKFDNLDCRSCEIEDETQKHILECTILNKELEKLDYEKIFKGAVSEKMKIARRFKSNMDVLEQKAIGT